MNYAARLYRQVHPGWVREGRITSQVFHPTPKDRGFLSVYDGDQITAAESWQHYTEVLGLMSAGVVAVTPAECSQHQIGVVPDPRDLFPEHTLLDFTGLTGNQVRRAARHLGRAANNRGWQFGPVQG